MARKRKPVKNFDFNKGKRGAVRKKPTSDALKLFTGWCDFSAAGDGDDDSSIVNDPHDFAVIARDADEAKEKILGYIQKIWRDEDDNEDILKSARASLSVDLVKEGVYDYKSR